MLSGDFELVKVVMNKMGSVDLSQNDVGAVITFTFLQDNRRGQQGRWLLDRLGWRGLFGRLVLRFRSEHIEVFG